MSELVEKWEKSGLLQDIDLDDKPLLSKYFEDALKYWNITIDNPASDETHPHAISSYLVVRKVFMITKEFDLNEIIGNYIIFLESNDTQILKRTLLEHGIKDWDFEIMYLYIDYVKNNLLKK